MTKFPAKTIFLLTGFFALSLLGGCGKKASHVYPPDDLEQDNYPFIYPDPATDPGSHAAPHAQIYQPPQTPKPAAQPPASQDEP